MMQTVRLGVCAAAFAVFTCGAPAALAQAPSAIAEQQEDEWVSGNLLFLSYHEVGHLLLDQVYHFDQKKNRLTAEQTADDIASWLLSPDPEDEVESAPVIAAIEGWLEAADDRSGDGPWKSEHYPDDEARAARIACMLYGSDLSNPNAFADLVETISLKYKPASCKALYDGMDRSLTGVFGDADDKNNAAPVARVRIEYDNAGPALQEARAFLVKAKILEELRDDLVKYVRKPVELVLRGASCGPNSSGFMYSPTLRQITACYEEVDWFLFGDSDNGAPSKPSASVAGDELGARPRRHPPLQTLPPPPPTPRR